MEELDSQLKLKSDAYQEHAKICKGLKRSLQILIDNKSQLESIQETYEKEQYHIKLLERMNKLKGNKLNYGFNSANKSIKLNQEKLKIQKKLESLSEEVDKINSVLLQNV